MSQRPTLSEAIDAYRPGDDLSAPELAALAELIEGDKDVVAALASVQTFDRRLTDAIDDVAVPKGLAERLIAGLDPREPVQLASPQRTSRRGWWTAAAALAAAILVAVALFWPPSGDLTVTPQNWQGLADAWYQQFLADEADGDWQPTPGPEQFPPSDRVVIAPQDWRRLADVDGVAYDLTPDGRFRATLFVVRADATALPSAPARSPIWTQGRSMSAWQSPGLLYVLVVEGPENRYRRLIDSGAMPVI